MAFRSERRKKRGERRHGHGPLRFDPSLLSPLSSPASQ
jgi:hypothetical protein